ncbi:MAG TPA: FtsX-like permease family protein [Caulobacteraceae bacterium]|jgi:putative ABC transport system permease protein
MLSLRFAARELRSGVRGFRVFLACLALGVAAIAAAGSTAEAFRQGLASEARTLLGGDLAVSSSRSFKPEARRALAQHGKVAYAAAARAMAAAPGGERRMVQIRGVDRAYPLAGAVDLTDGAGRPLPLRQALRDHGAAVEAALLERLGLKLGDSFTVADKPFIARAVLQSEPDRLTRGFALGPRVLVSMRAFDAAGFRAGPGFDGETARLALTTSASPKQVARDLRRELGDVQVRERTDAAPGIGRLIDQLEYFLGFIGLSSLVAGGLGVSGAVSAHLRTRRPSIAVLKALGAKAALIRDTYLIQIAALSALGIVLGLAAGAAAPFGVGWLAQDTLPVPALFDLYPEPLKRAALFGVLAAAAFSLAPLARARATPPSSLFRRELNGRLSFGPEIVLALVAAAGLAALAVLTAPTRLAAAVMISGVAVAFALLWLLGRIAAWLGGRSRSLTSGPLRVGLANLAGPRSAARTAAPAIGLGVALLTAVVLIQSTLLREIREVAPRAAPALVFTEIAADRAQGFDRLIATALGPLASDRYLRMPVVTGRILAINGQPVERARISAEGRWAFDRDIAMTALAGEPAGAEIEEGRWWPAAHTGEPRLALEARAARAAGVKVGDVLTLTVAGRELNARVAVLRRVNFGGFGPAFGVVLNADALEGANLQSVAIAKATPVQEAAALRALAGPFPEVNVISVREQLQAATRMFERLALAVRAAAGVAVLAGVLVLSGAIAAGARERAREAATLKVLGASRRQVLLVYAVEYGAVGLIAGLTGAALGYAAAWPVVVRLFHLPWSVDWAGLAALVGGAAALALLAGVLAAWRALAQRPAPVLRAE